MNTVPTTSDIKNYVQGNLNYFTKQSLPIYQLEQIELRKYLCDSCANSSNCLYCGCKSPNLFYAPSKVDAKLKWGPFMSEVQWNILKDNIDQYAEYFKVLRSEPLASSIESSTTSAVDPES